MSKVEKRELEMNELSRLIDETFGMLFFYNEPYRSQTEYYPYRIFSDGRMICNRRFDMCFYSLIWTLNDDNSISFSDKSTWEKVEESYIPTGEISARSSAPFKKPTPAKGVEKRVIEIRMAEGEESRTVTGYAAVFNSDSEDLGGFTERIAVGAFADALVVSDVRALFNHDANHILARSTSGTLRLLEDEKGLKYEFDSPNTSAGNDLLEMIKRGDISQSSFGFTVERDTWEKRDGKTYRTINKVKRLFDVSPVTYPAYADASVAVRSLEQLTETKEESETQTVDFDGQLRSKILSAALFIHA